MLEGIVANLLNRFLGIYVRNFDPKQLNVGIWSGDVKLHNLELRREALDQLHLPINVIEGHLGLLTLTIPWSNLRGKPVHVNIEDVYLLAAPRENQDYDPADDAKRAHALKMEKLDSAELLKERSSDGMTQEEQQKNQSFTASLTTAIVDNLQISVKNVHIRYEDSISDPGHPFAAGLTLHQLSAVSTDDQWKPTFVQGSASSSHKLATLAALAIYWDTDVKLIGSGRGSETADQQGIAHDSALQKLKDMIATKDSDDVHSHQYILKPVTGRAGLEMDKTGKPDRPKTKARLLFNELGFVFDDNQYRDMLMLVDLFHYYLRHQEYRKLQPKSSPKQDPRAWLRFAANAVRDKIHDRNKHWSWAYLKERRDDRTSYISLFKKKKKDEPLTPDETKHLDALEHKATYEDLRFWRSLTRSQLRKENVGVKKAPAKQTWSSWVWGGAKADTHAPADDSQMSDEQRSELYNAIDFDEKKQLSDAVDMPRDAVKLQVDMGLREGSFTLKRDPHGINTDIVRLAFQGFDTSFLQRTDSMLLDLSLETMSLLDGTTEGNLYRDALRIKDAKAADITTTPIASETTHDASEALRQAKSSHAETPSDREGESVNDPFFAMTFEQNPLDGHADSKLSAKLKAMEYVYNPNFVVQVANFFKPPERQMESIGALMETAGATVEGLRQQTRAGLEFALQEHKTIDAKLDLQAPLIIVPDSVTNESSVCLILDAGHIAVRSDLIDKDTMDRVQAKQKQQYTDEDFELLSELMYDKFDVSLDSMQLLLGPSVDSTKKQLHADSTDRSYHVIEKTGMNFKVETCILPKATHLTKFRVNGHLPILHASVSDHKYKSLMKLLDHAVPRFENRAKTAESDSSQNQDLNRPRSKSFMDSEMSKSGRSKLDKQQHELVIDEEGHDMKQAARESHAPSSQRSDTSADQRNFEFSFKVDKLQGSLYRADPKEKQPDQLLVDLVARRFSLDFHQRLYDMTADVKLGALTVEDHIEDSQIAQFRNLVSSDEAQSKSDGELLSVKFLKVDRGSPEFHDKYEGIATNLDVAVSTINLMLTRKSLLTLLDFVLATFTGPSEPSNPVKTVGTEQPEQSTSAPTQSDKIRIKTKLKRIAVIFNNDGVRLATLSLRSAEISVFLAGSSMTVGAKLGQLSLIDDVNQGAATDSALRQLISIEGQELADFRYETFDPSLASYPGHDAMVYLRSGSIKVNFVTEPFRKLMEFGIKFGKMQTIFNAARQAAADQASNMSQRASRMRFDIIISTPIIAFPRMLITDSTAERDTLTAHLGEVYLDNEFVTDKSESNSSCTNKLSAGVRNIRLTSRFSHDEDKSETLELIDKVDLDFKISSAVDKESAHSAATDIDGSMSDVKLKVTEAQLKFIMELTRSIPEAFTIQSDEQMVDDVQAELPVSVEKATATLPVRSEKQIQQPTSKEIAATSQSPELGHDSAVATTMTLAFKAGLIGLELVSGDIGQPIGDLDEASLSRFSLNDTKVKLRMVDDGSIESELLVQSFTITDTRTSQKNKFRKIMSLINTEVKQQFMASVTISGGSEKNLIALLTIDSPRVILALDYLFAVQRFITAGLSQDAPLIVAEEGNPSVVDDDDDESDAATISERQSLEQAPVKSEQESSMSVAYRVNLVDAQVVLIANPAITNSEAIVLGTKQIVVSQQHAMTLQVDKLGMFLCRMDKFETTRLRILDDFSVQTSFEMGSKNKATTLTSIHVEIEPLVLRLSLRDILLAVQIFQRASAMSSGDADGSLTDQTPAKIAQLKASGTRSTAGRPAASTAVATKGKGTTTSRTRKASSAQPTLDTGIVTREEMTLQVDGIRVVLIGDRHELPIVDWNVKSFSAHVKDWSGAMTADTSIDMYLNVYNFSKSAWEPLMEPWQLGFHMARAQHPEKLSVELYSRKSMEISLTSATIALASKSVQFLASDEDVLAKPRGSDAPFRISNYTGFDVSIRIPSSQSQTDSTKLGDGESIPWRFADPHKARETLAPEGATGMICIKLEDSGFEGIDKIPVSREGEVLYNLRPKQNNVQHRVLIEVRLGTDNVKTITIRSPLLVENQTQIPVEMGVFDATQAHLTKINKIPPGEARPSPVGAAFDHFLVVRPDQGFGYNWSDSRLYWKDMLKRPSQTITCRSESNASSPPFYFQAQAIFDRKDPLSAEYPYQRIRLCAPIEVQNLLPFDLKYRIYDKNTKKDWTNFLRKGGISPVHVVELSHLLLMSVDPQDTPFKPSEFAIINASEREDFRQERSLELKDKDDLTLRLRLHYL